MRGKSCSQSGMKDKSHALIATNGSIHSIEASANENIPTRMSLKALYISACAVSMQKSNNAIFAALLRTLFITRALRCSSQNANRTSHQYIHRDPVKDFLCSFLLEFDISFSFCSRKPVNGKHSFVDSPYPMLFSTDSCSMRTIMSLYIIK